MGLEDYFPFLLGCGCYKNTTKNKRSISNKNISGYAFQEGVGSDDLPKSCRFAFFGYNFRLRSEGFVEGSKGERLGGSMWMSVIRQ